MSKQSKSFPKPAKPGPAECPPTKEYPTRQRYNMAVPPKRAK